MSFRDLANTTQVASSRHRDTNRSRATSLPPVRAMPPVFQKEHSTVSQVRKSRRLRRPIVLHGRVQRDLPSEEDEEEVDEENYEHDDMISYRSSRARLNMSRQQQTVRKQMERRSVYAQLLHETNQYQKNVAELEQMLPEAGESPEAAWRSKILMKSAQAVDQELWKKLYEYERSLRDREDPEVLQAQTACMKLHRDFKRSHKALVMAVNLHEKKQRAEMARLGAVGWSEREDEEDFYTRAMREREEEIRQMNLSMHQVKDLYQDLGFLIEQQQEPIDRLEDTIEEAHAHTKSAWEHLFCYADRDAFCQTQQNITIHDGTWRVDGEEVVFMVPSCNALALDAFHDAIPESLLPPRKGDGTENSIVSEYTDESPRGVVPESVSAMDSQDYRFTEDAYEGSQALRVSEDFHWLMPFETMAADIRAVHNDIVQIGRDMTSEVLGVKSRTVRFQE